MWRVILRIPKKGEPLFCVALGASVEWVVEDAGRRARDFAIVSVRVEVYDSEAGLQEINTGDEGFTLDAILVEVRRVPVRGCDENDAVGH